MAELFVERGSHVTYVTRADWPADAAPSAPFDIVGVWRGEIHDPAGVRRTPSAVAFALALFRHFVRHRRTTTSSCSPRCRCSTSSPCGWRCSARRRDSWSTGSRCGPRASGARTPVPSRARWRGCCRRCLPHRRGPDGEQRVHPRPAPSAPARGRSDRARPRGPGRRGALGLDDRARACQVVLRGAPHRRQAARRAAVRDRHRA